MVSSHQFASPAQDWTTRSGQLSYHSKRGTMIGEILVRYSARGDFELTFSKGPGLSLLLLRTDPEFAQLRGPLAGVPWSGRFGEAPARVRGWLKLREEILRSAAQPTIKVSDSGETFVLRF